jgi:protein ImuB
MKRYVSIWLPYLVTDWLALHKPELKPIPFVVKVPSRGRMVITSSNPLAQRQGIHAGMVLADARAVYPSLHAEDERTGVAVAILKRIAQWCIRFTPFAGVDADDGIILDATGCSHLWGGDDQYVKDLISRIQSKGFIVKVAMADTIGAAWAAARFSNNNPVIPPGEHTQALLQFPLDSLRLERATVQRLQQLGLYQVKDIASMQRTALRRRFGKSVLQKIDQAFGTTEEYFEPVIQTEPYEERLPCIEPIVRLEGIQFALEQLLDALCKRLAKEGKGIRSAELNCYRLDGKIIMATIGTSTASVNAKHLFKLFELKLSSIEPDLGIELFVLVAKKLEEYDPKQQQFWKQTSLNSSLVSEFVDRVAGKIGEAALRRYLPAEHFLPERSFRLAESLKEASTTEWYLDRPRPIVLLPTPEGIEVTAPIPDYPPMMFRYKGKLHKIMKADGPERIEQEWWIRDGRHRDYYAVEDEKGCRYWLFRSGHYDAAKTYKWFIHGFFA